MEEAPNPIAGKKRDKDDYSRIRILVIEDEDYIRQIITRMLRQIGFEHIYEAADGTEGFKEIMRTIPDIILCDIHMKPIDGMTFLKKIRKLGHPKISGLPVIFLTSDTDVTQVKSAKELRVDGYIAKPVSPKLLKQHLDDVLERKGV